MRQYKRFSDEEKATMQELKDQDLTNKEIAELIGTETKRVENYFKNLKKKAAPIPQVPAKPEKTLDDFQPRELIKHLYKLGYRIDRDGLYVITRQKVNLQSVINE